jgi:hypothetical protein
MRDARWECLLKWDKMLEKRFWFLSTSDYFESRVFFYSRSVSLHSRSVFMYSKKCLSILILFKLSTVQSILLLVRSNLIDKDWISLSVCLLNMRISVSLYSHSCSHSIETTVSFIRGDRLIYSEWSFRSLSVIVINQSSSSSIMIWSHLRHTASTSSTQSSCLRVCWLRSDFR